MKAREQLLPLRFKAVTARAELTHGTTLAALENVWLLVSTENQETYNERVPELLQCPAVVRGISAEPLLGPIDLGLGRWIRIYGPSGTPMVLREDTPGFRLRPGAIVERLLDIDWAIIGGESGVGCRPNELCWTRGILLQIALGPVENTTAPFLKQLGGAALDRKAGLVGALYPQPPKAERGWITTRLKDGHGGDEAEFPTVASPPRACIGARQHLRLRPRPPASSASRCSPHALRRSRALRRMARRVTAGRRPRVRLDLVEENRILKFLYPEANRIQAERPHTRGDCVNAVRPCPWVGCRHHLYLDVSEADGSLTLNFAKLQPWELEQSCALDVADQKVDGLTLQDIGQLHDFTREQTRQIELAALENLDGVLGVEPAEPRGMPKRSRQHGRIAKAIRRMSAVMLYLARAKNSTSIRSFVAALEHARTLVDVVKVITSYLAGDPKIDARAVVALRALACAAAAIDPMSWPIHLLDVMRELAAFDAEIDPDAAEVTKG